MAVLILRQRGPNRLPDEVAAAVEEHPNLRVLDRSAKMLRIEGDCQELQAIADLYPDWTFRRSGRTAKSSRSGHWRKRLAIGVPDGAETVVHVRRQHS